MTNSQKLINMDVQTLIGQTRGKDANPGGGAILILVSNLAINLMLMMDKSNWDDLEEKAIVSRETILDISKLYTSLMQDDVDYFNELMNAYKQNKTCKEHFINASKPLETMVNNNQKAMQTLSFYLENGKKSTITDGEIANDLLKTATISALPTIKLNVDGLGMKKDFDQIERKINELYQMNKLIIERRNKW